jgi:hypothetical protein
MFGGPEGPDAVFGSPEDNPAGCVTRLATTGDAAPRRVGAARLDGRRGFGDDAGACTVSGGSVREPSCASAVPAGGGDGDGVCANEAC